MASRDGSLDPGRDVGRADDVRAYRDHAGTALFCGMSNFISVEIFAVARPWRLAMDIDLQSMSLDELWALHETICLILARKLEAEKRSHEQRLNELRRKFGKASNETPERRPYPKVHPKFLNPKPPHQTWSGRGHQPSWVRELLAGGKTNDDLRISTATA